MRSWWRMGAVWSAKRVPRVMCAAGFAGVSRRKGVRTTRRNSRARPAPDLVQRDFTANAADRLWVANISDVPSLSGFVYRAVVLDAFSRRIVGWAMASHLRIGLGLDALEMALAQRRPGDVAHHSDSEYLRAGSLGVT